MIIRLAQVEDALSIAALHAASRRAFYRGCLSDEYLNGDILADRNRVWLSRLSLLDNLHVAQEHQSRGIGEALLNEARARVLLRPTSGTRQEVGNPLPGSESRGEWLRPPMRFESGLPGTRRLELISAKPLRSGVVALHYRRAS